MVETIIVSRETFQRLRARLPAVTREHLSECYAISETTWTKLRDGKPVKRSTLDRILQRYDRLDARVAA
jgi:DNA-binding Xre family transcriptional regulator